MEGCFILNIMEEIERIFWGRWSLVVNSFNVVMVFLCELCLLIKVVFFRILCVITEFGK